MCVNLCTREQVEGLDPSGLELQTCMNPAEVGIENQTQKDDKPSFSAQLGSDLVR